VFASGHHRRTVAFFGGNRQGRNNIVQVVAASGLLRHGSVQIVDLTGEIDEEGLYDILAATSASGGGGDRLIFRDGQLTRLLARTDVWPGSTR
jgi:hypothetical protein